MAETKARTNSRKTAEAKSAEARGAETKAPGRRRITRRKANEALVRSYFEAIAARDVRALAEHWTEDGVDDIVPQGPLRGRQEIADYFADVFAASPDVETTVTRVLAGERQVAAEWRMRGTFDGAPFQGIEPTGKTWELRGLDLFDVEDGQITGNTGYFDGVEFGRQIGMLPPLDSGADRAMRSAFNAVTKVRRAIDERRKV